MKKTWLNVSLFFIIIEIVLHPPLLIANLLIISKTLYQSPWEWVDELGQKISLSQFKGKPLVITMTYTSCRMSCPLTMRKLQEVRRDLEKKSIQAEFVMVTLDPRLDTYQRLAQYKKSWNLPKKSWHFLTGEKSTILDLSRFLGIRFQEEADGHINHDNKIIIIDQEGKIKNTIVGWDNDISEVISSSQK